MSFKDDKKNDQGIETYPDGKMYVGEFKDDKRHGQGTFTSPDGSKYVGEYDGMKRGQGVYINWDGKILSGTWDFRGLIKEIPMEEVKNYLKNKYPQFEGFD